MFSYYLSQGLPHALPNELEVQQHSDLNVVPGILASQLPLLIFVQQLPLLLSIHLGDPPNENSRENYLTLNFCTFFNSNQ